MEIRRLVQPLPARRRCTSTAPGFAGVSPDELGRASPANLSLLPPRAQNPPSVPPRAQGSVPPLPFPASRAPGRCCGGRGGHPGRARRRLLDVAADVAVRRCQQPRCLCLRIAVASLGTVRLRLRRRLSLGHPDVARVRSPGFPPRCRILRCGHSGY